MAAATAAAVAAVAMDRGAVTVAEEADGLGPACLFGCCCCCCAADADAEADAEEEIGACGCWRHAAKNVERKKDEERV